MPRTCHTRICPRAPGITWGPRGLPGIPRGPRIHGTPEAPMNSSRALGPACCTCCTGTLWQYHTNLGLQARKQVLCYLPLLLDEKCEQVKTKTYIFFTFSTFHLFTLGFNPHLTREQFVFERPATSKSTDLAAMQAQAAQRRRNR